MVAGRLVVAQQARRPFHRCQHEVEIAVAVDVGDRRAARHHRPGEIARTVRRHGDEARAAAAAGVPEQARRLRVVLARLHLVDLVFDVAVGRQQIQAAVQVVVEKQHAEGQRAAAGRSDAGDDRLVGKLQRRLLRDIQRRHLVGEVADGDAERTVVAEVGRVDAHRAAAVAVGIERDAGAGADLLERAVLPVVEDEVLHRVVGDDEIGPAVARRDRSATTPSDLAIGTPVAGFLICTPARADTSVKWPWPSLRYRYGKCAFEGARRTVGAAESDEAEVLLQVDRSRPADVVADEEIEVAVAVVVEPGRARAPLVGVSADAGRAVTSVKCPPTLRNRWLTPTAVTNRSVQPSLS